MGREVRGAERNEEKTKCLLDLVIFSQSVSRYKYYIYITEEGRVIFIPRTASMEMNATTASRTYRTSVPTVSDRFEEF